MIVKTDVKVVVVELKCDSCGAYITNKEMLWDNKNTHDMSDDTMSYKYTCDSCGTVILDTVSYPHQEFIKVTS